MLCWNQFECVGSLVILFHRFALSTAIYTYPKELKVQANKDLVYQLNSTVAILYVRWGLWKTDGTVLDITFFANDRPNEKVRPIYSGRFDYFGNITKGYAWYTLRNLTLKDNGVYGVKSTTVDRVLVSLKTNVIVTETPKFAVEPNALTKITEHKNLSINCSALGPPTPHVTWINVSNGMANLAKGNGSAILKIPKITRHYNGQIYKCQAENNPNEGPSETSTVLQVNYSPEFVLIPENKMVVQGYDITLNCLATSIPRSNISWKRESGQLKHGYSVASDGTLTIPTANKTDAGKYICNASNYFDEQRHSVTAYAYVVVKYEPSITVNTSSKHIVNESDSVALTCQADGNPEPTITWTKKRGSIKMPNIGKNYSIFNISKGDAGTYVCTASNGIGKNASANIEVIVQYKASIDSSSSNITAKSWKGNTIKLRCKWSDALPIPTWSWSYPNATVISANIITINKGSEVTLTTGPSNGDYGLYTCNATNEAGSASHRINVTRLFPPGPPIVTVTNVGASSAQVHWTKPVYNGGSLVTGYKVEVNQKTDELSAEKLDKTISDLGNNKSYEVKVWAKNVVGYGNFSVESFKTKFEGEPALPVLTVVEIQELSVKLRWTKPADNGGTITQYTVYQKEVGVDEAWKQVVKIYGDVREKIIGNLEPGKKYSFVVTASNHFGESLLDNEKKRTVEIPVQTTTPAATDIVQPSKGNISGYGSDTNQTIIIVGAVVAVVLIVITAIISIVILRKKDILGKKKPSSYPSAAYHNDGQSTPDSLDREAAVVNLHDDGVPTYAAVDKTKKTKKTGQTEIPNYAAVDKSRKKKRPGEIIYAELADFNTHNIPAAPRPVPSYAETDYADISQFQNQSQQEPTYANFSARNEEYNM